MGIQFRFGEGPSWWDLVGEVALHAAPSFAHASHAAALSVH